MSLNPDLNIAALVSVGQHPTSRRARRAAQDARAVEVGVGLVGQRLRVVHAGIADQPVLRQYMGMGLGQLTVLKSALEDDVLPALLDHFSRQPVDVVLTGVRAESGEGSGLLPYLLAERLGWPIVPRIAEIRRIDDGHAEVLQALPRGQRRALKVSLPFIATVDNAAPEPRQFAFGPGQRGAINIADIAGVPDTERSEWEEAPARPRPKRLNVVKAKSAADRFKAATAKPQGQGGRVMKDESNHEKAQAILDLLIAEGVVR